MKKKCLFLLALLLMPAIVFAKDDPGLWRNLYEILDSKLKDNVLVINDFQTLNACALGGTPEETDEMNCNIESFGRIVTGYINTMPEVKKLIVDNIDEKPRISAYCISYTNCGIAISYENDMRGVGEDLTGEYPSDAFKHYDIRITVNNTYSKDIYNKITSFYKKDNAGVYTTDYYVTDLSFINHLYNSAFGIENMVTDLHVRPAVLLKSVPEVKELFANNPELELMYADIAPMGNGWDEVQYLISANFMNIYNKVAYMESTFVFHVVPVVFVDEATPDDQLIAAAKKRIEDYIHDEKMKVVIDDITATFTDEQLQDIYTDLDNYLTTLNLHSDANTRVYSLQIGAQKSPRNFYIIKASKSLIKDLVVQTIARDTGVKLVSSSVEVPMDSQILVTDVTGQFSQLNKSVEKAYDISLYSEKKGVNITSVAGGMKIYIPVADDFELNGKQIVYLNAKGEATETFETKLETVEGKKYVTFVTTHLSVYGLIGDTGPNTADFVTPIIIAIILSLVLAIVLKVFKPKAYR